MELLYRAPGAGYEYDRGRICAFAFEIHLAATADVDQVREIAVFRSVGDAGTEQESNNDQ